MTYPVYTTYEDTVYLNGTPIQQSIQGWGSVAPDPVAYVPSENQVYYAPAHPYASHRYIPAAPVMRCVGLPSDGLAPTNPPAATPHRTLRRSRGLHLPSVRPSPRAISPRIGPFQFLKKLHSCGFGSAVYARDLSSGRGLCLKMMDKRLLMQKPKGFKSLEAELQAYQVIANSSPCKFVMDCHGVLQDEKSVYLAMDCGSDMHSFLGEKIQPRRMKKWIAQIALGIAALHNMGIIHRDIKPENILVDQCDNIKIFDYGSAYIHHKRVKRGRDYTGELAGTREYLAPEYFTRESYGPEVDYWALGCTVFDLIVGDTLFETTDSRCEYLEWDANRRGSSYFLWRSSGLSESEVDLLSGLLSEDPNTRYTLSDLQEHPFFFDNRGRNIFDEILRESYSRATPSDFVEPGPGSIIFYPSHEYYDPNSEFDQFRWINPRGIWSPQ